MGKYGVTVNIVRPGATQTDYITPEMERGEVARIPLGQIGEPEDIGNIIASLASEQVRWVTGQVITASGGFST